MYIVMFHCVVQVWKCYHCTGAKPSTESTFYGHIKQVEETSCVVANSLPQFIGQYVGDLLGAVIRRLSSEGP